jgi:hypothetical protein
MKSYGSCKPFPEWFSRLLELPNPLEEKQKITRHGIELCLDEGILRATTVMSDRQRQTEQVFGFKWHQRDTFESETVAQTMQKWSNERYN